jgi:osmoprotectant transport system substrate-binding protein
LAAPVARKDTLKKFPALPRLIAKTKGLLPDGVLASLAQTGEPARSARQFLREKKLI